MEQNNNKNKQTNKQKRQGITSAIFSDDKEMVISTSRPYYLRVFVDEWMDGGFLSQLKQKLKEGKDGGELRSICRLTLLLENVTCMYTLETQKFI